MGTKNGHTEPFFKSVSLKKKKKVMSSNKTQPSNCSMRAECISLQSALCLISQGASELFFLLKNWCLISKELTD